MNKVNFYMIYIFRNFFLFVFAFVFSGCREQRIILPANPNVNDSALNTRTYNYDFSDPSGYSYSNTRVEWSSNEFKLKELSSGVFEDFFDDDDASTWVGPTLMGSSLVSATESLGELSATVSGSLLAIYSNVHPVVGNQEIMVTVSPEAFSSTGLVGLVARRSQNRYYTGLTYGGNHRIMYFDGGRLNVLDSEPSSFSPEVGSSYNLKLQADASVLRYKAWIDGTDEPATWLVEVENNILSAGVPGLMTVAGVQDFSWFSSRDLDVSEEAGYSRDYVSLRFPEWAWPADALSLVEIVIEGNEYSEELLYELSLDGGTTWYVPSVGQGWSINLNGANGATELSDLNAALDQLELSFESLILRTYMRSDSGDYTPSLRSTQLRYSYEPSSSID